MTIRSRPVTRWQNVGGLRMRICERPNAPVVMMCPRARCVDDPNHQPDEEMTRLFETLICTCGERVETGNVKALPAF